MKRLLFGLFGFLVFLIFSVPSFSAEFSMTGYYRVRGFYFHNINLMDNAFYRQMGLKNKSAARNEEYWDHRLTLMPTIKINDHAYIKGRIYVQNDVVFGGGDSRIDWPDYKNRYGNDVKNFEWRWLWGELYTPIGNFWFGRPYVQVVFGTLFNYELTTDAAFAWFKTFAWGITPLLYIEKVHEGNVVLDDDTDAIYLDVFIWGHKTWDGFLRPFTMFWNNDTKMRIFVNEWGLRGKPFANYEFKGPWLGWLSWMNKISKHLYIETAGHIFYGRLMRVNKNVANALFGMSHGYDIKIRDCWFGMGRLGYEWGKNYEFTTWLEAGHASGDEDPFFAYGLFDRHGHRRTKFREIYVNKDYDVDLILFEQIIGSLQNCNYIKLRQDYKLNDRMKFYASVLWAEEDKAAPIPTSNLFDPPNAKNLGWAAAGSGGRRPDWVGQNYVPANDIQAVANRYETQSWTAQPRANPANTYMNDITIYPNPKRDKYLGVELDFGGTWTVVPNVDWSVDFGYLFIGDAFRWIDDDGDIRHPGNVWTLQTKIQFNF